MNPFRENYWSARWVGLIAAPYKENYYLSVQVDGSSDVRVYVGGK